MIPRKMMTAARIAASVLYITISVIAAASAANTPFFYNTEIVAAIFTIYEEESSRAFSKTYCAAKCAAVRCYRLFWENGACHIERRRASQFTEYSKFQLKRV